jgi:predicted DNA-binding transcriptional regulator YafY
MATNKHATIRYIALDKCFSNFNRKCFIDDLINACNEALYEFAGIAEGVKRRQIFDDITFMESDQGYSIELERHKDGKKVFYRYSDKNFSINNHGLNASETKQLKETLQILTRFKGLPDFDWVAETKIRFETLLHFQENSPFVEFEENPFLTGLEHFKTIFDAIQNQLVINITYHPFGYDNEYEMILHPYYLKQFNSRWFLFGYNPIVSNISNLAFDRIIKIEILDKKRFIKNEFIDFKEYFEDSIGVTITHEAPVEILLQVRVRRYPYIKTKPLHGSQTELSNHPANNAGHQVIKLIVQINKELITLLLSFANDITVLEPESLKETIKNKIESTLRNYT